MDSSGLMTGDGTATNAAAAAAADNYTGTSPTTVSAEKNGILTAMFSSCSPDPRGSVHRAWGISLLFVVVYFVLAIFESKCSASLSMVP